jgi:uncharacterized membrane protein
MFIQLTSVAFSVFFLLDMVWLGLVAKRFYALQLGYLMRTDIQWPAALMFYALFIVGLVFFVILPAAEKRSWEMALSRGALFGLITYATYDLTNLATIKGWPMAVTVVDLCWGTVLSALVSYFTIRIASLIRII